VDISGLWSSWSIDTKIAFAALLVGVLGLLFAIFKKKQPIVIISNVDEDQRTGDDLSKELRKKGIIVLGSRNWAHSSKRENSRPQYYLELISTRSVSQNEGYRSLESYREIEQSEKAPPYLIPVRIDDCAPSHERLKGVQYVNLFEDWRTGVDQIVQRITRPVDQATVLRTDGLYVAEPEIDVYRYYNLRFFTDGEVVAVSSDLLPKELAPYMTPSRPEMSVGRYTVRRNRVEFSTLGSIGIVHYQGSLTSDKLILDKNSQINHHRNVHIYSFKRVKGLSGVPQATDKSTE